MRMSKYFYCFGLQWKVSIIIYGNDFLIISNTYYKGYMVLVGYLCLINKRYDICVNYFDIINYLFVIRIDECCCSSVP